MSRKSKRWLTVVAVVIVCLIVIVAVLHTPPVERYALEKVEEYLRSSQGIELSAGSLQYNLLTLTFWLKNLSLRTTAQGNFPPFLTVSSLDIEVSFLSLFRGRPVIENAYLSGVNVQVVRNAQGKDNLPVSPEEQKTPGNPNEPLGFLIEHLQARRGSILYADEQQDVRVQLPDWDLRIEGNPVTLAQNIRFDTVQPGSATSESRTAQLQKVFIEAVLRPGSLEVKQLQLDAADSQIAVAGTLDNFAKPTLHFNVSTGVDLATLGRFAGFRENIAGRVKGDISIAGPLEQVVVAAQVSGSDLALQRFRRINLNVNARWDRGAERVRVESLALQSPVGSMKAEANLALAQEAGESSVAANISHLDLERIAQALDSPVELASRATISLNASWPGLEYQRPTGQAQIRLASTSAAPSHDVLPVSGSITAKARGTQVFVDIASLTTLGSDWHGQVSLESFKNIGGSLHANVSNLGQFVSDAEQFLGEQPGSLIGTKLAGAVTLDTTLAGTLSQPQVGATLYAPALEVANLRGVSLNADVSYSPQLVDLEALNIRWKGQNFAANGQISLGEPSPRLNLNASVTQGSLTAILAGLGQNIPVEGSFSLDAKVAGTIKQPEAQVSLSGSGLKAYGETLGDFALEAGLANQELQLTKLQLDKPLPSGQVAHLQATGSYNLESYAYTIEADTKDFQVTSLTLPGDLPVRGGVDFSVNGTGTISDPSLELQLDVADLRVRDEQLGVVNLTAQLQNHQATLGLKAPQFNLTTNASLGTQSPYPTRFEISADGMDLSKLPVKVAQNEPLTGSLNATIAGSGDLAEWQKGQATVRISSLLVKIDNQNIRNEGPVEVSYQGEGLTVESATLAVGESRLSASGSLPLKAPSPPGSLEIKGVLNTQELIALIPGNPSFSAKGTLDLNAMLRGSLERLEPTASLTMQDGSFDQSDLNVPVTHINLDLHYAKGLIAVNKLSANLGPADIQAKGELPLRAFVSNLPFEVPKTQGAATFALDVKNLELSAFRAVPESVSGTIGFHIEGETPRVNDLNAWHAQITFNQLQAKLVNYEIKQAEPAELTIADGTARIKQFLLTGPSTRLQASGTAGLTGNQALDLHVAGDLNIGIVTLLTEGFQAAGESQFQLAVAGRLPAPELSGFFEINQGQFGLQNPRIAAQNLNVRLDMSSQTVKIAKFTGTLNGGDLNITGSTGYSGAGLQNLNFDIGVKGAFFDVPEGLRTEISADLTLRSQDELIVLGGKAHILEGSYRRNLEVGGEVMNYLQSGGGVQLVEERNSFLAKLRFNVSVDTEGPLLIDNNLAKLTLQANLRLTGTYYRPGVVGRVTLDEGGKLYFNERTYLVQRGIISFVNQAKIEPDLNILATTKVGQYDINLNLTGTPENFSAQLTSEPSLSQPDIIAVLLTGRTLDQLQGSGLNVAREQVESYLSGQLAGFLSRGAEETLGLSQVRIEPSLINPEANPGARLTIGEDITNALRLIYSMNLVNSGDEIYIVQYDVTRRFQTEGTKQSDNTYRFDLRHDLQFGGNRAQGPATSGASQESIGAIEFTGNTVFPPKKLVDKLGVESGDKYNFFKLQKGIDRLEKFYDQRGYLESRVRIERNRSGHVVNLSAHVEAGPKVQFVYEGRSVSGNVKKQVKKAWRDGLFDAQRTQGAVQAIRTSLIKNGYLESKVDNQIASPSSEEKRIIFDIRPGVRFHNVAPDFEGASKISPVTLNTILKDQELTTDIYLNPSKVTNFLSSYYHQHGYLDARISPVQYDLNSSTGTGTVVIPVKEGPLFKVGKLEFHGNKALTDSQIEEAIPLSAGETYRPELLQSSYTSLEELYWNHGYNDVVVDYTLKRAPETGFVDADFQITENKQQVVQKIDIEGNQETSNNLVRTQLALSPGDVLDYQKTNQSRKRLYDTNAYTLVEIEPQPVKEGVSNLADYQQPVALQVKLKEVRPFELRYGGFYDTDRGPGGIVDFSNRNSLGSARLVGVRTRYDSDIHELRGYFSQPFLRRFPVDSNVTGFFRREIKAGFNTDITGFSLQQEAQFQNKFVFSYGYRFEKNHTYDTGPNPFFDITLNTAPLTTTLTRDTRDDILDATHGSFASQAFEYAPSFLGSNLHFAKYFGQYFKYLPLSKPAEVPWVNKKKVRFVYAGAARVGLAGGFGGQDLIGADKFFAGGGTTIRGFGQDQVGPKDFLGDPVGGDALLIINNEIRFPVFSIFDGVGFLDIGNVYPHVSDFNPTDVRRSAGFGLRVRTPYFLLRADYGIKLDRKPGESFGKLFFSIGQAF